MSDLFSGLPDAFIGVLGQAVRLVDEVGLDTDTRGIFQHRTIDDLGVAVAEAVVHLRDADADTILAHPECRVEIDGVRYIPRVGEADGKGMTPVRLEKDQAQ